jgi:hypothetical protein
MASNALVLSLLYLGVGLTLEATRRLFPSRLFGHLATSLDALPARCLDVVGLLGPLRVAYTQGLVGEVGVRLLFGLTTVGVIFALALAVGTALGLVRILALRGRPTPPGVG